MLDDSTRHLLDDASTRAARYLDGLDSRPVAPSADAIARLAALDVPLPAKAGDPLLTLRMLDEFGSPATMAMAGPRFFGFVIGGALPVTLAAQLAGRRWDQNSGAVPRRRPATAALEQVALRWLLDVLHLPPECGRRVRHRGDGGQLRARSRPRATRVLARAGWDVEARRTVRRAAGHGRRRRRGAPDAVQGARPARASAATAWCRCRSTARAACAPTRCPRCRGPTIVCVQAGNVNTGAFDPVARGLRARARGRRLGARRRRVRAVGRGRAVARAPRGGHRERRLVGDRRAQVAQRALRQRPRVRARRERAARRDGHHRRVPAHRIASIATRRTTRPSCRAARAASRSGRRCGRSAAPACRR